MGASHEWTEYHLTPRGWESGSERVDFAGVTDKAPPLDRVLTIRQTESLSSMYSKMDRYTTELWRSDDTAAIAALTAKFGAEP